MDDILRQIIRDELYNDNTPIPLRIEPDNVGSNEDINYEGYGRTSVKCRVIKFEIK